MLDLPCSKHIKMLGKMYSTYILIYGQIGRKEGRWEGGSEVKKEWNGKPNVPEIRSIQSNNLKPKSNSSLGLKYIDLKGRG